MRRLRAPVALAQQRAREDPAPAERERPAQRAALAGAGAPGRGEASRGGSERELDVVEAELGAARRAHALVDRLLRAEAEAHETPARRGLPRLEPGALGGREDSRPERGL